MEELLQGAMMCVCVLVVLFDNAAIDAWLLDTLFYDLNGLSCFFVQVQVYPPEN